MSLLKVQHFLGKICAHYVISIPKINLSRSQKILIICLASGTLILGSLAQFFKRRRRLPIPPSRRYIRESRQRLLNSSNSDAVSQASWARRSEASTRSLLSDRASLISSVPAGFDGDTKLSPQQYGVLEKNCNSADSSAESSTFPVISNDNIEATDCHNPLVSNILINNHQELENNNDVIDNYLSNIHNCSNLVLNTDCATGLEALEKALYCWEDALTAFSSALNSDALALPSKADAAFTRDVQKLLDLGYEIQNNAEMLFIDQHSVLFRNGSESEGSRKTSTATGRLSMCRDKHDPASSPESYASAKDGVADLREFEEFSEYFPHFEQQKLYHTALKQHEEKGIPCRMSRSGNEKRLHTELVKCGSDVEYLAKVHCLRRAFTRLFTLPSAATWIADVGRQLISDLIIFADRDPKDYLAHYERMLEFLSEENSLPIMQEELGLRGVKCINFYDVVIDFILLDAFEEVDKPPSSIKAILQNRWISTSFRETAIGTAVWSVLMGKRQLLKYPKGFMAHFYSISEQVTPVLVWGFLGPENSLQSTCYYFREQIIEFLIDIFNIFKVRYTNVDNLAEDILREMKIRVENINQRLSLEGC